MATRCAEVIFSAGAGFFLLDELVSEDRLRLLAEV